MLLLNLFSGFFCFYLHIKCISCENSSLGFVIDDTWSMQDDIDFVKRGAKSILDLVESKKSNINNIVLVTFNDPEVKLLSKSSKKTFLKDLYSIYAHGGGDCPEMALSGIIEGLKASGPESYIFVFTDANAGDSWKLREIQSLCQKKQSQVIIVYSHDRYCYQPYGTNFTVYYDIAKSCSGQVIILEKNEVDMVLKIVTSLLGGRHSIFKWTTIYSAPNYTPVEFKLDEKAEYAMVSVTSGSDVYLKITYENLVRTEVNYEKIMWNKNSKVAKLIKPKPGTYKAWVQGYSHITIVVYGRTDFTFNHGFSTLEPKSMIDTIPQPIAGIEQHVSINVTDPANTILIKTLQILGTNNVVFATLPLKNIGNNLYVTDVFRSPNSTFKIGITGIIKATGNEITRYSNNIIPRIQDPIPQSAPKVEIAEGTKLDVNYGSDVKLTCRVTAHPKPTIEWYSASGNLLSSVSSEIDDPKFLSYLNVKNFKKDETFTCKASNRLDTRGKVSTIKVGVKPIFNIVGEVEHKVNYQQDATVPCNIKSYLPINIKWFRSGKLLSGNSKEYSVSPDGSQLTLRSMNLEMQGKYVCEATLSSDPTINKSHDRIVKIDGLEAPVIHNIKYTYYGVEGDLVLKIPCNVTGSPVPNVYWSVQNNPNKKPAVKGSTLQLSKPVKLDSAVYVCHATNALGYVNKQFKVIIVDSFEDDDKFRGGIHKVYVEEGKSKTLKCNVPNVGTGSVRWYKDGLLSEHKGTTYTIENASLDDEKNYTCRVNTDEGSISETYVLNIGDIPTFDNDRTTTIDWKHNPTELDCKAYGNPEPQFKWEHNGNVLKTENNAQEIDIIDWGEYKCQVSNEIGNISRTFKVKTSGCFITKYIGSQNQPLLSTTDAPTQPTSITNSGLYIETNAGLKFSCPNPKQASNKFKVLPGKREIVAKCIAEDKFNVDGKTYRYSDLQCNTKVVPSVSRTGQTCSSPNSEIIRVGFEVKGFLEAYKICYDTKLNVPLYGIAVNEIVPDDLKFTVDLADFTWSSVPELGNAKTGNWKSERNCTCCYKQGQLINVNTLALGPIQDATFKDNLNAIPIWNTLCDKSRVSWEQVEKSVMFLSAFGFNEWHSWTGASEYLFKDGGLVPRYLWKVVKRNDKFSVVVFVNDGSPVDTDIRCSDTCDIIQENRDKFLYCCTLDEFSKRFGVPLNTFKTV